MKLTNTVATLFFCCILLPGLRAQQVSEAKIKMGKSHRSGFVATSKFSKAKMSDILATKFSEAGLKKHRKKSKFLSWKGVVWPVTGPNKVDLYYKVVAKKHAAKVYFIASKGYDNYITSASDASAASSITNYLGQLDAAIALNEEITAKASELNALEANVNKEKADLKKAQDDKNKKAVELQKLQKARPIDNGSGYGLAIGL